MYIRKYFIEKKVEELLKHFQYINPPIDIEGIVKKLGINLKGQMLDDKISGVLYRGRKNDTIIIYNEKHHEQRQRFTIAHEIGHYFLHQNQELIVDKAVLFRSDKKSGEDINNIEVEANKFAAELLMPKFLIENDFKRAIIKNKDVEQVIKVLAEKYNVSLSALTIRLNNLGFELL